MSKNHHPKSVSTSPQFFAALIFKPAGPISALEYLCRFDPTLFGLPVVQIKPHVAKTAKVCRYFAQIDPYLLHISSGLIFARLFLVKQEVAMQVSTLGQNTYAGNLQQKQQKLSTLYSAIKSGDILSAQKAYVAAGFSTMPATNTSPLGRLYQALRNGDLPAAQEASLEMQGKGSSSSSGSAVKKRVSSPAVTSGSVNPLTNVYVKSTKGSKVNTLV